MLCSCLSTCFNASLSLLSILSYTSALYPPNFPMDSTYLFLVSSYFLPYFLDYILPPYCSSPFRYFLPYSPTSYGWQPCFRHAPCVIFAISTFSRPCSF